MNVIISKNGADDENMIDRALPPTNLHTNGKILVITAPLYNFH